MDDFLYGIAAGERGSPEWEEDLQDKAEAFADACAANSGEILPYISTSNTARDLDLLRAVLGDSALNYLGYSRSEERRVGQECVSPCRSRWPPHHKKKKK